MKNLTKSLLIAGSLLAANVTNASLVSELNPYMGADYKHLWMQAKKPNKNLFPKSYPGADFYLGARFYENFALELGYSTSKKQSRVLPPGTVVGPFNVTVAKTTRIRVSGGYIDFIYFVPVAEKFELLASLGYSGILRLGLGGQYMLTDMVGLRAKAGWERTSDVRTRVNGVCIRHLFEDAVSASAGVFVKF